MKPLYYPEVICPNLAIPREQQLRLRAQQREAERQGEHLFQALLQRAFRGEV
jgi:hypothetical protein